MQLTLVQLMYPGSRVQLDMHHSTHLISISELEHILQDDAFVLHFKRFLQNPEGPLAETDILEAAESSNKDNREYPIQHTLQGASSSRIQRMDQVHRTCHHNQELPAS